MAQVTHEMVFMRMEDIGAYAEARLLVRLTNEMIAATPGGARDRAFLELQGTANAVAAALLQSLQSTDPVTEIRCLREVSVYLTVIRDSVWELYSGGLVAAFFFDELMKTTARCRREALTLEAAARHRGRRRLDRAF